MKFLALVLGVCTAVVAPGCQRKTDQAKASASGKESVALTFKREGTEVGKRSLQEMLSSITPVTVEGWDPYYQTSRRFRALPIEAVLTAAYKADTSELRKHQWLLKALDGFAVPISGDRLFEGGAAIAFEDLEHPGSWDPIGPQKANPGPLYLVWSKPTQTNLHEHPRPWQLATFEITTFEAAFPHTDPKVAKDHPAARGYAAFRTYCISCHAINREGGRVGPELNVPQSIVEYRPEQQIRAYIRNPLTFRYGNMPAHLHLTDQDLDGLIAYFGEMKGRKYDPEAKKGDGAH